MRLFDIFKKNKNITTKQDKSDYLGTVCFADSNFNVSAKVQIRKSIYAPYIKAFESKLTEYGINLDNAKRIIHKKGDVYPELEKKYSKIASFHYPELSYILCLYEVKDNIYLLEENGNIISSDPRVNTVSAFDLGEETERLFEDTDIASLLEKAADTVYLDGGVYYCKSKKQFMKEIEIEPENPYGVDPCSSWVKVEASVEYIKAARVTTSIIDANILKEMGLVAPYALRRYLIRNKAGI